MLSTPVRSARSTSTPTRPLPFAASSRLCAETLAGIADPLFPALTAARVRAPSEAAQTIFSALLEPLESPDLRDTMPSWLMQHQADAVARARAILQRFGGALIADGVGLGKTYIALALVLLERARGGDAVAFVPASLTAEWRRAAREVEVPLTVYSHASLARRAPPPSARCSLVVVDEAHAFRNPRTRRYDALARLAAGRRVALLTATPLNNSPADVAALVHLFAARDRFRELGVADLTDALRRGDPAASLALGAISVCRTRRLVEQRFPALAGAFPRRILRAPVQYPLDECYGGRLDDVLESLRDLIDAGGNHPGAALSHLVLLKRLESSRAAFRRTIGRHRDVLDEVIRAAEQGVAISRAAVRASWGAHGDASQLALWPLLTSSGGPPTDRTIASARDAVERLINLSDTASHLPDRKIEALRSLLHGPLKGRKVIVFTEYRDTALYLLRELRQQLRVMAVSGDAAWAGTSRLRRQEALDGFAPVGRRRAPNALLEADVLIATDVASEGLNLQDAGAVVNYDLPWNPVRVMQRIGRVERLHSPNLSVEVAHLVPAGGLRALTAVLQTLRAKLEATSRTLGAEPDPLAALWWLDTGSPRPEAVVDESWSRVAPFEARERWRALAGPPGRRPPTPVIAAGCADDDGPPALGMLLALEWRGGRRVPLAFVTTGGAAPTCDPEALGRLATRALLAQPIPADSADFVGPLATILTMARELALGLSAARRGSPEPGPGRRAALDTLSRWALEAQRLRLVDDAVARATELLARDLPAGHDRLLARLVLEPGAANELAARIVELLGATLPPPSPPLDGTPKLVLVAAIVLATRCPSRPALS